MPTHPRDMTDLQLESTLQLCFTRHRTAEGGRRGVIQDVIRDVLEEQKIRRDEALGLTCQASESAQSATVPS